MSEFNFVVLVGVSFAWKLYFVFKPRIIFDTSSWVVFLKEKNWIKIPFFNIKNTGVFSKRFNNSWERFCIFWEKKFQWLGIFTFEKTFNKNLILCTYFFPSEICFSVSLRIIFSTVDAFFVKRGATVYQKLPLFIMLFEL